MTDPGPALPAEEAGKAGAGGEEPAGKPPRLSGGPMVALLFLAPALVMLTVLVLYPIGYTVVRSLFNKDGDEFVGLDNYVTMFTSKDTLTAIRNNVIWVVLAPTLVTIIGLIFAVLTERIRWGTAFKAIVFMPMAISFLATGVTFSLVYDQDPERGALNAVSVAVHDTFVKPSTYPNVRGRDNVLEKSQCEKVTTSGEGQEEQTGENCAWQARSAVAAGGEPVLLPLIGLAPDAVPTTATDAPSAPPGAGVKGVVWLDLQKGKGAGKVGGVDSGEKGLPGITVEAVDSAGKVVATTKTTASGAFEFPSLTSGSYTVRLPADNFTPPFRGVQWLGPALVTPSIIISYLWIWAGFAMVLIAAGLASIPRDALEAARVDGATEWQVFRKVTIPLVRPVLLVVVVTLVINVLKIFDLVLVLAPESVQASATVVALEMWRTSFGGSRDFGLGSALGVLLFLLVLPALISNIRRFKREQT